MNYKTNPEININDYLPKTYIPKKEYGIENLLNNYQQTAKQEYEPTTNYEPEPKIPKPPINKEKIALTAIIIGGIIIPIITTIIILITRKP